MAALDVVGNPASTHASGRKARGLLENAREYLADALGAQPDEVVFTSGGSEADSLAVLGTLAARPDMVALISAVEHPAVAEAAVRMPARVRRIDTDANGVLDLDQLRAACDRKTGLVSVMWVNNETGTIQPLAEVVHAGHEVGAVVHSDAVQAIGHVPINFQTSGLDLLSLSAHKVGGPVGVGALLVRRGTRLRPIGLGGGQEFGVRSGTQSVLLAVAMAAAVSAAVAERDSESARLAKLRSELIAGLATIPEARVNGGACTSDAICNVTFWDAGAEALLLLLDRAGIDCSTGSACKAGVHQPSEVLLAMGRSRAEASSSLRFSFGPTTTEADIVVLVGILPELVAQARAAGSS